MKYAVRNPAYGWYRDIGACGRDGKIVYFDTKEAARAVVRDPCRYAGKREVVRVRWALKCAKPDCGAVSTICQDVMALRFNSCEDAKNYMRNQMLSNYKIVRKCSKVS